jgi:translation initiation factor 4E
MSSNRFNELYVEDSDEEDDVREDVEEEEEEIIISGLQKVMRADNSTGAEHKLENEWCLWYMQKFKNKMGSQDKNMQTPQKSKADPNDYEKSIKLIGAFNTIESFWTYQDYLVRPGETRNIDYHLFRKGIKPIWEDEANKAGGKWIVRLKKGLAARYWELVVISVIGEALMKEGMEAMNSRGGNVELNTEDYCELDDEICGAVLSIRYNEDVLAIWNRNANNQEALGCIRDGLKKILNLPNFISLEYKRHDTQFDKNSNNYENKQRRDGWRQRNVNTHFGNRFNSNKRSF